jgi:hypothetical protein
MGKLIENTVMNIRVISLDYDGCLANKFYASEYAKKRGTQESLIDGNKVLFEKFLQTDSNEEKSDSNISPRQALSLFPMVTPPASVISAAVTSETQNIRDTYNARQAHSTT